MEGTKPVTNPDTRLLALGATTLVTLGGLGALAFLHQDPLVAAAWREVFDDASKLAISVANAVRETHAFGHRIGGTYAPTLLA